MVRVAVVATVVYAAAASIAVATAAISSFAHYNAELKTYTVEIAGTNRTVEVRAGNENELAATMRKHCKGASCVDAPASISPSPSAWLGGVAKDAGLVALGWALVYAGVLAVFFTVRWIAQGFAGPRPDPR
jgi:hypothetical protein